MKKRLSFLFLFLLVTGLVVWKYVHRPVHLEKQPIVLGHGGMGVRSPYTLDSKKSIEKALSYPIDGSEIDVQMTLDNVLIAYHDPELPQLSGCPGHVWEKTYSDIYECSHGVFHRAAHVEALDTLVGGFWKKGTIFSLDLKPEPGMDSLRMKTFVTQIVNLAKTFDQYRFLIESQDLDLLTKLGDASVTAELFYYVHEPKDGLDACRKHQLNGISINAALITKEDIVESRNVGIQVMIWGSGSVFSNRKLLELEADIIQTDAISSMVTILER